MSSVLKWIHLFTKIIYQFTLKADKLFRFNPNSGCQCRLSFVSLQ